MSLLQIRETFLVTLNSGDILALRCNNLCFMKKSLGNHLSRGLSISSHLGDLDPAVHSPLVHLISFAGHHHETTTDRVERVRHGHRTGSDDLQQNNPELGH